MESFVEIELFQDNAYVAGQQIFGKINLFGKKNLNDVARVTVSLYGEEQVQLHLGKKTPVENTNKVIDSTFTCYDYTDYHNVVQAGPHAYPFAIKLPPWLPQSSLCLQTD